MELRNFGTTGRQVAVIGQGTWYSGSEDRKSAISALVRGLDLGMTHIDTAEMYLSGEAEEWVSEAIAGRRDEVFLVSKVLPRNASRKGTLKACEASLARLHTDRLDCYLLHWRTDDHPLADAVEAFGQLMREGKILSWGVSNFDIDDLEDLRRVCDASQPACNQVLYHLQQRAVDHFVMPACEQMNAALVAYSPFGHGSFPHPSTPGGRLLQQIADETGATPRQVALRFLLQNAIVFAIPKSSDGKHAAENAGAGDVMLTEDQVVRLNAAFPMGRPPKSLPML